MMAVKWLVSVGALAFLTTGCTAQLAPAYDQTVATGLMSVDTNMYILFAAIGTDASKSTYSAREASYNQVIGELRALDLQAKARPLPPDDAIVKVNSELSKRKLGTVDPTFSEYPSARSMEDAVKTLTTMQTADKMAGLHGSEIAAFENQATTYMTQAVTYENFLKR